MPSNFTNDLYNRIMLNIVNENMPLKYDYIDQPIQSIKFEDPLKNENEMLKKQIDNMAKYICDNDIDEVICSKIPLGICEKYNNGKCKECIKNYFKDL